MKPCKPIAAAAALPVEILRYHPALAYWPFGGCMSIADQIFERVKPMPESLAREVLHFAEYLNARAQDRAELGDLSLAQEKVMKHVWDNPDDEAWNDVESL